MTKATLSSDKAKHPVTVHRFLAAAFMEVVVLVLTLLVLFCLDRYGPLKDSVNVKEVGISLCATGVAAMFIIIHWLVDRTIRRYLLMMLTVGLTAMSSIFMWQDIKNGKLGVPLMTEPKPYPATTQSSEESQNDRLMFLELEMRSLLLESDYLLLTEYRPPSNQVYDACLDQHYSIDSLLDDVRDDIKNSLEYRTRAKPHHYRDQNINHQLEIEERRLTELMQVIRLQRQDAATTKSATQP